MIKVIQLIARMNVGGPAFEIQAVQTEFPELGIDSILVTGKCGSDEQDFLERHQVQGQVIQIENLQRAINPSKDLKSFFEIRRLLKELRPDVLHTHTSKAGVLGRLAAISLLQRPKLVHTFHGHVLDGYFWRPIEFLILLVEKFLASKTDLLLCIGSKTKSDIEHFKIASSARTRVVPTAILYSEDFPSTHSRHRLGLADDLFVVIFSGRLTSIKRIDRLIEIMKLSSDIPNLLWLILGDGPDRGLLELARDEFDLPIKMLGWRDDVQTILPACDVSILVSDNEGTPLSIVEAGYFGVPSIATNVGSVSDLISHGYNGILVSTDPVEIARAVRNLNEDREFLAKISNQVKVDYREQYSARKAALDHAHYYQMIK